MKTKITYIIMCLIIIGALLCSVWQIKHYQIKIKKQQTQIWELQKERNKCCLGLEDCKKELRWEGILDQILTETAKTNLDALAWKLKGKKNKRNK